MGDLIECFIEDLRRVHFDDVFNPYDDRCLVHDIEAAPELRRLNIKSVFSACSEASTIDIWIGRDLGHRGGRRTGIALADEYHLEEYAKHLKIPALKKSTISASIKEQTATCIFQAISLADVPVLTWNVFPFHPYEDGNEFSNRCHSRAEAAIGVRFLSRLLGMFHVRQIIAIGSDAAKATNEVGKGRIAVRHPSYGGKGIFLKQMAHIYRAEDPECEQFELAV